jgi:flagellar biosynthesis protein FlhB
VSDKTEEPTPKRLKKAREEGDSGQSPFAAQAVAFVVAVALVPGALRLLVTRSGDALRAAIGHAADASPRGVVSTSALASEVLLLAVPVLTGALVAGAAASVVQTGGFIATKKLTPKLEHLNFFEGVKRLVSGARLFAVARALLFAAAALYLAYRGLGAHLVDLARTSGRLAYVGAVAGVVSGDLARDVALTGLFLAAIDVVVVRRGWRKRLRMSKDEVKREHKETEGDPQIKAARERAHQEMLAAATIANVKTASVVVINPTHIACALRYDEKERDEAPVVVASGEGDLAAAIVRAAQDYGVPVLRDVPLARALIELQVGDAIPEALYEAVAEILRAAWEEAPPER